MTSAGQPGLFRGSLSGLDKLLGAGAGGGAVKPIYREPEQEPKPEPVKTSKNDSQEPRAGHF